MTISSALGGNRVVVCISGMKSWVSLALNAMHAPLDAGLTATRRTVRAKRRHPERARDRELREVVTSGLPHPHRGIVNGLAVHRDEAERALEVRFESFPFKEK